MRNDLQTLFDDRFQGRLDYRDFLSCQSEEHVRSNYSTGSRSYVVDDELRSYHQFLLSTVVEYLSIDTEHVYSYRKNSRTVDAVKKHAMSRYLFKTDLRHFFSSIDDELVRETIRANAENFPFSANSIVLEHIVQLLTFCGTLPPGFASSPGISNACLYKFDKEFGAFCSSLSLIYTRYSDDIVVSGDDLDLVRVASFMIEDMLQNTYGHRFLANAEKSRFLHRGKKVNLLGLVILPNGHVTVDRRLKTLVETLLYCYTSDSMRFVKMTNGDIDKGAKRVAGYLNHFRSIDPSYVEKLRRKYGKTIVDYFIDLPKMNFN